MAFSGIQFSTLHIGSEFPYNMASKAYILLWEVIRELARPHEHLSVLAGAVLDLGLLGLRLGLELGVGHPDQVTVGQEPHGVAGGAHLLVHLVPAPSNHKIYQILESMNKKDIK